VSQAEVVLGDLSIVSFGLGTEVWNALTAEADVVVHKGTFVSGHLSVPGVLELTACRSFGCTRTSSSRGRTCLAR
jgi:hypothetical protein